MNQGGVATRRVGRGPQGDSGTSGRAHCARPLATALAIAGLVGLFGAGVSAAAGGDPARGRDLYGRCVACHALDRNRTGPMHCGVFGRTAGTVPGFRYSAAMRRSGLVWSMETLDRFIEDPRRTIPGTSMGYAGVKDATERADLLAYILEAQSRPDLCP